MRLKDNNIAIGGGGFIVSDITVNDTMVPAFWYHLFSQKKCSRKLTVVAKGYLYYKYKIDAIDACS